MRRTLVAGDDTAHHPFLQTLPRHIRHGSSFDPVALRFQQRQRAAQGPAPQLMLALLRARARITMQDLRDFLLAYCACFLAFSVYLA